MAAFKSMISYQSATLTLLLVVVMSLVLVHIQTGEAQAGSCTAGIANLNVCAPFVVPGSDAKPSSDCCSAVQAMQTSCLCETLRVAAQIPAQCNLPPVSCGTN